MLDAYPLNITKGADHIDKLTSATAKFGGRITEMIEETDEMGDPDTADLLTSVSQELDKYLWFMEVHLD